MSYQPAYAAREPSRADVDAEPGLVLLEFGAPWCPHCVGAQPAVQALVAGAGAVTHLKIEDGRGLPLGRSFRIKQWPTLVLLSSGRELARVVRPRTDDEMAPLRAAIAAHAAGEGASGEVPLHQG